MANTQFQLEGNAAALYEKYTVPTGARPSAEGMLDSVTLNDADRVLDAACGTGIVARLMAQGSVNVSAYTGLDLNENMLDLARDLEPNAKFPIAWQQGDICALPFLDAEFDIALCNHGVQFVPDKPAALLEIRRVLAGGGRFAFTAWSAAPPMNEAMADSLRRHIGDGVAKSALSPFAFRDAPTIENLLREAGFSSINMNELTFKRRFPATEETIINLIERAPFAKDVREASDEVREMIKAEVYEAMQPFREGDEFVETANFHLAQAVNQA